MGVAEEEATVDGGGARERRRAQEVGFDRVA